MDITTEQPSEGVAVVALAGELDASNFESVIEEVRRAYEAGARSLILDLEKLTYMGSSGLVAIHAAAMVMRGEQPPSTDDGWDVLHRMGHRVEAGADRPPVLLAGALQNVDRVLERTGMKRLFEVHPDRDSALAAVAAGEG
jgi:anti-anti-sigma regulatory factor